VDKTGHEMQQQQQQPRHHNWTALTPSEARTEEQLADLGPADPADMRIGEAFRQDLAAHMAADACLSASRQHKVMTMMTMVQVLYTFKHTEE